MQLLLAGIDRSVLRFWLGHESVETTQMLSECLTWTEERIIESVAYHGQNGRFTPGDQTPKLLRWA